MLFFSHAPIYLPLSSLFPLQTALLLIMRSKVPRPLPTSILQSDAFGVLLF